MSAGALFKILTGIGTALAVPSILDSSLGLVEENTPFDPRRRKRNMRKLIESDAESALLMGGQEDEDIFKEELLRSSLGSDFPMSSNLATPEFDALGEQLRLASLVSGHEQSLGRMARTEMAPRRSIMQMASELGYI